jgi:type II secretory pathway pseudopilin PulG
MAVSCAMKPRPLGHALSLNAFTRIELLVILTGLLVLFALVMPPCCGVSREGARRGKTATVTRNITHSANAYATDYGTFPNVTSPRALEEQFIFVGDRDAGTSQRNGAFFDVLRAIPRGPNAGHVLNNRQQKYFEEAKATDPKNPRDGFADGNAFSDTHQGSLFDPWGVEYCIVMETDRDGSLNLGSIYSDLGTPATAIAKNCVAFSLGKDGKLGGKTHPKRYTSPEKTFPEDIASWDSPAQ